jgi:hypothetical protein
MSPRVLLVAMAAACALVAQDPPSRVGRLNFMTGSVSFQPGGASDWVPAALNRPLTVGDQIFADDGARAEIHIPGTAFRLGSRTSFEFLNLDDHIVQVRLSEGSLGVRVRRLEGDQSLEVDTPNLAFTILRTGDYRIDTNPDSNQTYVTVRSGDGQITSNSGAFAVHARQQAVLTGQDQAEYGVYAVPGNDDFDNWVLSRDAREDRSQSSRYVSPNIVGYEDLDDNGSWESVPDYGAVWTPREVPVGWAPYHNGHWAWVDPWGWTWVDDAPWGFAPFHYGRWAFLRERWCWVPGPIAVAPVYAPALVAWFGFGGSGPRLSVGFGGAGVGWFPLGPRDVYLPSYRSSPTYVTQINTSNTTVINNIQITNVYNTYVRTGSVPTTNYANRNVRGAMVAVPQNSFASARPVQQVAVKVQANQINSISRVSAAPRVAPQMASLLGHATGGASVPRPSAAVTSRAVVAKTTPPPAPATFNQRQALLAKDPGRPIPIQQQQKIARPSPATPVRVVQRAPQVTPPVANTTAPARAPRPNVPVTPFPKAPASTARPGQPQPQAQPRTYEPPAAQPRTIPQAQPNRPIQPPAAQPRSTPQAQPNRPAEAPREQPRAQPQPSRPIQPPAAQPRSKPQAQPNRPAEAPREQPRVQPQPNRPIQPPAAQPRSTPQAQPNRPAEAPREQPRVQPQPNRPIQPPAAQPRSTPQAQPNRPVEPPRGQPRVQPQPNRPIQPPAAQPRSTPQAQPNRSAQPPREQPRVQPRQAPPKPPAREAQPPKAAPAKPKPTTEKKTDERK